MAATKNKKNKQEPAGALEHPSGMDSLAGQERPKFPIVGIGASAGGLAAFEAFFSGIPGGSDPGMAFVLVQHLAPDHKSLLSDLVRRYTKMQVFEVKDGMRVEPNCAYIIPPNRDMAFLDGTLQLLEPSAPRGMRLPIDFFFRSLAQDQHERAIGIVLSGTGSDGTLGVRAIKGEGGMMMAQNPESTEYDGMPRSAIATGLVDYVLPPAEMPAQLIAYVGQAFGKLPRPAAAPGSNVESPMKKIFVLLRVQTGHDFSQYKQNTIVRRVERRMAVHQVERQEEYVRLLQQEPAEVESLFRDLLIGVTSFFRDPGAFAALKEQAIPKLFAGKPPGAPIRVWVPGCSTGEEAYSIAILLQEHLHAVKQTAKIQVFATDIDHQAVEQARSGLYPASIAADVSPERLAQFFTQEPGGSAYRMHKSIRDMLVFSEQDVIKDPPFSRVDLISCRNLLIYMGVELQKKLVSLFHYALNSGGFLFLGTSESVGEYAELFATADRQAKLFRRKEDLPGARPGLAGLASTTTEDGSGRRLLRTGLRASKSPLRELTERTLLEQYVPAAVLVDERGEILYVHGHTGKYLEPAQGEAGMNLVNMAREGLQHPLAHALREAAGQKEPASQQGLQVRTNGDFTNINLTVHPLTAGDDSTAIKLFLVAFQDAPPAVLGPSEEAAAADSAKETSLPATGEGDARIAALRQELRAKEEHLQSANEKLETTNEELKSSNEEMQSVNEELRSTNEELETAKEELQSVNEELATVNAELQQKVADLSRANNDMNNLLAGTGIGTIFVDHQLRILRFTPAVTQVINLILTDIGRPVSHIVSNLVGYDRLVEDVRAVLNDLIPREVEVQTKAGARFALRIRPYRTLENVIEGAVITFVDLTQKHVGEAAHGAPGQKSE
jgi:two-component system CheB/CheR fusion protein